MSALRGSRAQGSFNMCAHHALVNAGERVFDIYIGVFITTVPVTKLFAWGGGGGQGRPCDTRDYEPCLLLQLFLLLQYLLQSCSRGGGGGKGGHVLREAIMAIPYTGLFFFVASCNSRSSHGQYTRSSTEHFQYGAVTSARLLGQNYRNRNFSKVRNYVLGKHLFSNQTMVVSAS
jgi:hypothetical protein